MTTRVPKEIVFSYFGGNASALQKKLIRDWLSEPGNAEIYFEWLQEWETGRPQFIPDPENAFDKFSQRISESEAGQDGPSEAPNEDILPFWSRWKWAAVFIFSLGIAAYSFRNEVISKTYSTAYQEQKTIILPDDSKVVLDQNSRLQVPRFGFGKFVREVVLEGEASFSVTHTIENTPFQVATADRSTITVLGTEFVVYARNKGTQVFLNKGKVQLATKKEPKPHTMSPGDKATVTATGDVRIKKMTITELATPDSWKEHQFEFHRTSLSDAVKEINEVFGVNVVAEDKMLSARELSGTFKARNAGELLDVLSEMLNMDITLSDNTLYLTPKL